MFCLSIAFGQPATIWMLMYQTEEKAKAATQVITDVYEETHNADSLEKFCTGPAFIKLEDDFGQSFAVRNGDIVSFMLEDLSKTQLAHAERALHQARTQAKAQKMAEADSELRNARMSQGPAILQPGMMAPNGRFS